MKEKHIFWTPDTDEAVIKWVDGKGKDDILYLDHIHYPLTCFARYLMGRYAMASYEYAYDKEELCQELVTVASSALLNGFNPKKCEKPTNYIHQIIKNHIRKLYRESQIQKRKHTRIYVDTEDTEWLEAVMTLNNGGEYHSQIDEESKVYFFKWWDTNLDSFFAVPTRPKVKLILDVMKNPQNHPVEGKYYTDYLCQKLGISRQRLDQIMKKMAEKTKFFPC